VAEQQGLPLAEYLVLYLGTGFSMSREEAARVVTKSLARSAHMDVNGAAAVQSCLDKGLATVSQANLLVLSHAGIALAYTIANELERVGSLAESSHHPEAHAVVSCASCRSRT
jgi:hypothetical protein